MTTNGALTSGGAVAAAVVTIVTGTPARLPDISLGSAVLFHLERALALLGCGVVALIVVTRAWRGELPNEVSTQGLKYAPSEAAIDAIAVELARYRHERDALSQRVEALEREAYLDGDD